MFLVRYDVFSRLFHNRVAVVMSTKKTAQCYDTSFKTISRTCKKQELESCVRQTQAGPHIFLSWGNSRTTGLFVTIPFTIMLCSRPMFPPNQ